jgi:hypothetical protein
VTLWLEESLYRLMLAIAILTFGAVCGAILIGIVLGVAWAVMLFVSLFGGC